MAHSVLVQLAERMVAPKRIQSISNSQIPLLAIRFVAWRRSSPQVYAHSYIWFRRVDSECTLRPW